MKGSILTRNDIDQIFCGIIKNAVEELLVIELTAWLGYHNYDRSTDTYGNTRNGSYTRTFQSSFGPLSLTIPRDRKGLFRPLILPRYDRSLNEHEEFILSFFSLERRIESIKTEINNMYAEFYRREYIDSLGQTLENHCLAIRETTLPRHFHKIYLVEHQLSSEKGQDGTTMLIALGLDDEGEEYLFGYSLKGYSYLSRWESVMRYVKNSVLSVDYYVIPVSPELEKMFLSFYPNSERAEE